MNEIKEIQLKQLEEIKELLDSQGIKFFVDGGALLGFIRNGKLLEDDIDDIDLTAFCEDLDKMDGIKENFVVCEGGINFVYGKDPKRAKVEVYFSKEKSNYRYLDVFEGHHYYVYPKKFIGKLKEVDFFGIKLSVPEYPEKFLEWKYGEHWKTPINKGTYNKNLGKYCPALVYELPEEL